ncbi:hypothetical protein SK128_021774 [Halocaridina rubra]|uniref:Uncharacterized protein n=1 Tax=Halocaridina rubra TaxID=373956 RepID=A0AAN8WSD8_HALRR
MQDANNFLKAAFQIGPWRITRKVLLFVIVFCVVVILFSTIVLKTHMFDEDWEDFEWDEEDDWDDGISGGDSILLIIIGLSAIGGLIAAAGCCMAGFNSPEQLASDGSIFTLSGVANTGAPVATAPVAAAPRPRRQTERPRSNDTKIYPPTSNYPQGPSYPTNPGYPPHPPPYSAPGYPPPPPSGVQAGAPPPPAHTISDLPPPYAPGSYPNTR